MAKKTMGRKKIEIKRINCEASRQVTFSKRREGLFKKASEICTLCDANAAILVFSPAGKIFSFGHPDVESTVERFLNEKILPPEDRGAASVCELNQEYSEVLNLLEKEKRAETLYQLNPEAKKGEAWWETPMENLGLFELEKLLISMEQLKKNVMKRVDEDGYGFSFGRGLS